MKRSIKILALFLAVLMVFTACGKKENEAEGSGQSQGTSGIFDYSSYFDDNGYFKGVKAKDSVTLGDYKSYKADQAEIDTYVDLYLQSYPITNQVYEGVVQNGDAVNIDYVGTVDGVEFSGGNTQGAGTTVIIGQTNYIDDFLEQLIGHSVGDSFDINVTFPDEYPNDPDLEGKDAVFATKINYIVEYEPAELNDEFVATNLSGDYGWQTVSEMRSGIVQNLAMNNIYNGATFGETPKMILDFVHDNIVNEVNIYCDYFQQLAEQYNVDFETVLYTTVGYQTKDDYLAGMLDGYEQQAQYYALMQALSEDLGLSVSDKDVTAMIASIDSEDVTYEELAGYYGVNYLKWQVLSDKLMKAITAMAE